MTANYFDQKCNNLDNLHNLHKFDNFDSFDYLDNLDNLTTMRSMTTETALKRSPILERMMLWTATVRTRTHSSFAV